MSDDYQEPIPEMPNEPSENEEYTEPTSDNIPEADEQCDTEGLENINEPATDEDAETADEDAERPKPLLWPTAAGHTHLRMK